MEVAPEKIGVPVSQSRGNIKKNMMQPWFHLSTHSVSHKDAHTWTHSEEEGALWERESRDGDD